MIFQFLGRETTWKTIAAKRSPNLSVLTTTQVGYKSRYRFSPFFCSTRTLVYIIQASYYLHNPSILLHTSCLSSFTQDILNERHFLLSAEKSWASDHDITYILSFVLITLSICIGTVINPSASVQWSNFHTERCMYWLQYSSWIF